MLFACRLTGGVCGDASPKVHVPTYMAPPHPFSTHGLLWAFLLAHHDRPHGRSAKPFFGMCVMLFACRLIGGVCGDTSPKVHVPTYMAPPHPFSTHGLLWAFLLAHHDRPHGRSAKPFYGICVMLFACRWIGGVCGDASPKVCVPTCMVPPHPLSTHGLLWAFFSAHDDRPHGRSAKPFYGMSLTLFACRLNGGVCGAASPKVHVPTCMAPPHPLLLKLAPAT